MIGVIKCLLEELIGGWRGALTGFGTAVGLLLLYLALRTMDIPLRW